MNIFRKLLWKKHKSNKNYREPHIACKSCSGIYDVDWYDEKTFVRCSNYPKCKSTLSLTDFILEYLKKYGLKIYRWEKICYKCKKTTYVYSYYLNYELEYLSLYFQAYGNNVGLGDLNYVDNILKNQIDTIKMCYSNTTHSSYIANTCQHCGALQGKYYVVDDPHEILNELWHEHSMTKFLFKHLNFDDVSPLRNDIENIYEIENFVDDIH